MGPPPPHRRNGMPSPLVGASTLQGLGKGEGSNYFYMELLLTEVPDMVYLSRMESGVSFFTDTTVEMIQ